MSAETQRPVQEEGATIMHAGVFGDRPQGSALLAVLQPGDVVITPKLDRMFRPLPSTYSAG